MGDIPVEVKKETKKFEDRVKRREALTNNDLKNLVETGSDEIKKTLPPEAARAFDEEAYPLKRKYLIENANFETEAIGQKVEAVNATRKLLDDLAQHADTLRDLSRKSTFQKSQEKVFDKLHKEIPDFSNDIGLSKSWFTDLKDDLENEGSTSAEISLGFLTAAETIGPAQGQKEFARFSKAYNKDAWFKDKIVNDEDVDALTDYPQYRAKLEASGMSRRGHGYVLELLHAAKETSSKEDVQDYETYLFNEISKGSFHNDFKGETDFLIQLQKPAEHLKLMVKPVQDFQAMATDFQKRYNVEYSTARVKSFLSLEEKDIHYGIGITEQLDQVQKDATKDIVKALEGHHQSFLKKAVKSGESSGKYAELFDKFKKLKEGALAKNVNLAKDKDWQQILDTQNDLESNINALYKDSDAHLEKMSDIGERPDLDDIEKDLGDFAGKMEAFSTKMNVPVVAPEAPKTDVKSGDTAATTVGDKPAEQPVTTPGTDVAGGKPSDKPADAAAGAKPGEKSATPVASDEVAGGGVVATAAGDKAPAVSADKPTNGGSAGQNRPISAGNETQAYRPVENKPYARTNAGEKLTSQYSEHWSEGEWVENFDLKDYKGVLKTKDDGHNKNIYDADGTIIDQIPPKSGLVIYEGEARKFPGGKFNKETFVPVRDVNGRAFYIARSVIVKVDMDEERANADQGKVDRSSLTEQEAKDLDHWLTWNDHRDDLQDSLARRFRPKNAPTDHSEWSRPVLLSRTRIFKQIDQYGDGPDGVTFDIPFDGKALDCRVQKKSNGGYELIYNGGKIEYENKQKLYAALNFGGVEQEVAWHLIKNNPAYRASHEQIMGEMENVKFDKDESSRSFSFHLDLPKGDTKVSVQVKDFGHLQFTAEGRGVGVDGSDTRVCRAYNLHDLARQMKHIGEWANHKHGSVVGPEARAEIAFDTITNPLSFQGRKANIGELISFAVTDNEVVKMDLNWIEKGRTSLNVWVNNGDKENRGKRGDLVFIVNGPGTKVGPNIAKNFTDLIQQVDKLADLPHRTEQAPDGWADAPVSPLYGSTATRSGERASERRARRKREQEASEKSS